MYGSTIYVSVTKRGIPLAKTKLPQYFETFLPMSFENKNFIIIDYLFYNHTVKNVNINDGEDFRTLELL